MAGFKTVRKPKGAMKLTRRRFLHLAAGAAALPTVSGFAWAQTYPARPVRIVVPAAAGGIPDIAARLIGQWLSARVGQPFIIENRPGGGGNIGTEVVVKAAPDGHMLLLVVPNNAFNATLYDEAQLQLHPRHCARLAHSRHARGHDGASVGAGQDGA